MQSKQDSAIGMFDSGVGGLTVMKEVMRLMPYEKIIYFGDTARFPYGNQAAELVKKYSEQNASFLIEQGIKALVMACNTCSAYAYEALKSSLPIPIIDVIVPGAQKAVATSTTKHIAIIGTTATITSQAYQKAIHALDASFKVTSIPCPLLASLVEESFIDHPATYLIVEEYLKVLRGTDVDTLLLGCTHYPMLQKVIQKSIGDNITIIDSANACAEAVEKAITTSNIARVSCSETFIHHYFVSDNPAKFEFQAKAFLPQISGKVLLAR